MRLCFCAEIWKKQQWLSTRLICYEKQNDETIIINYDNYKFRKKNKNDNYLKYTDALIEFFWFENSDAIDHHHDMIKVKTWHASNARNSHNINV